MNSQTMHTLPFSLLLNFLRHVALDTTFLPSESGYITTACKVVSKR